MGSRLAARRARPRAVGAAGGGRVDFGFDDVAKKAQELAAGAFQRPARPGPRLAAASSPTTSGATSASAPTTRCGSDSRSPFQVQFFHPGLYLRPHRCAMNVVDAKGVQPVAFSPSQFDYGKNDFASQVPQDLGYAGLPHPLPDQDAELPRRGDRLPRRAATSAPSARSRCSGSRRAAWPSTPRCPSGEEFPYFKEFWLVRPAPRREGDDDLRAARQPERHRRVPLRRSARRADRRSTSRCGCSCAARSRSSASRR